MANSAAMKMIVGRTWKAKMNPMFSPAPPGVPSFPKTNCEPTNENWRRRLILSPSQAKTVWPTVVFRTKSAKTSWRTRPQTTVLPRIALRSVENR